MIAARVPDVPDESHESRELKELRALRASRRLARIHDAHRYAGVLGVVLGVFVFSALAPTAPWALSVIVLLQALMLALAMWTGGPGNIYRVEYLVIAASVIVAGVGDIWADNRNVYGGISLYSGALTIATIVVIALGVARQESVNSQSVTGAIGIYLLLGMFFVYVYGGSAYLGHSEFFVQTGSESRPLFQYFSFVTLATVGYGDYTAAHTLGRMLAIVEALMGQLYLVTVLAILVSQLGRRRR
jgi:Ion channel